MLDSLDPGQVGDARGRALLLIGFAAALCRRELAALRLEDLGVAVGLLRGFIAASKTDEEATGYARGLAYDGRSTHLPGAVLAGLARASRSQA